MKDTLRFEIVTGIKPGYNNLKFGDTDYDNIVALNWQHNAAEEYKKSGIYISAVIKRSVTVYDEKQGCPCGGERTCVISGIANKEYIEDLNLWKYAVLRLAEKLKKQLGQEFMTCEFIKCRLYCLNSNN